MATCTTSTMLYQDWLRAQPRSIVVVGKAEDFSNDPFSDFESISPCSEAPSPISELAIEPDPEPENNDDVCLENAKVRCCRCEFVQSLFPESESEYSRYNAVCEKCAKAICRKCEVLSESVIPFDTKSKATVPHEAFAVFWYCGSCGGIAPVPEANVVRANPVSLLDIKSISCPPCQQKASTSCLFVAILDSSLPLVPKQPEPICEPVRSGSRPRAQSSYSEGCLKKRPTFISTTSMRHSRTIKKIRRWTMW